MVAGVGAWVGARPPFSGWGAPGRGRAGGRGHWALKKYESTFDGGGFWVVKWGLVREKQPNSWRS